jgi:glycosyltransferase involved in cell wall biosynthesis
MITLNEAANLPACLASLPDSCELVVVDSGSDDATRDLAARHGARVYERAFTNFAEQKNAAIDYARGQWVLVLDADETISPRLRTWLSELIANPGAPSHQAFRLARRLEFMGRRMRWGKTQDAPLRLFRRGAARFEGAIHERLVVASQVVGKTPPGCLWHRSYHDLTDYFQRFNRYTSQIAEQHRQAGRHVSLISHCLRPWFEFITRYIFRLGFLDGYPGYTYALLSSLYAYVKYAKVLELEQQRSDVS